MFVLSPKHSTRTRLLVAGAYGFTLFMRYLLPQFALAVLLLQLALGIALIFVRRWEYGPDSIL
jgi:hypothetical protein